MNWSITTCAPLAKSPNCASQITSAFGSALENPVLESEHRFLGEHGIDHQEASLVAAEVLQRYVGPLVPALAILVVQDRVTVRERAAPYILPREPHVVAVGEQRAVGKRFRHAPIHPSLALRHVAAVVHDARDRRMQLEAFGNRSEPFTQPLQLGKRHLRVRVIRPLGAEERRPVDCELALEVRDDRVERVLAGVQRGAKALDDLLRVLRSDHFLRDQPVGVELAGSRVLRDLLVHQRLRDERFVLLVMPELAEAHDVDHHVLVELLAVVERELRDEQNRLRVVAVDVKDRRLDHLRHVRAIDRRACVARVGRGEADLVVDDQVHRAAGAIAAGPRQVQRLHDHALPRERGVAVDEDRQHLVAGLVVAAALPGTHRALHHRIDDFQVRGVERERDVHRPAAVEMSDEKPL
jgi:hypothetical protein